MGGISRYLRLWGALGRYGLIRELSFRGNFLIKVTVEMLWLGILLIFYRTVFSQTNVVASWSETQFLFFIACHYALGGVLETFFLSNCGEFADLIRSGDLDFYLVKPIDEQFLVTCRNIDWSTVPNILVGVIIMIVALNQMEWNFDVTKLLLFGVAFLCGVGLCYSFLLILTSSSVWLVRNQSLYEVWWLFTTLMRYPRDIFMTSWAAPIGLFFTFIIPIMLVINVPANTMVKIFDPWFVLFMILATGVLLIVSRMIFRAALRTYRSASS